MNSLPAVREAVALTGAERAAIVLRSLGRSQSELWRAFDPAEIEQISEAMVRLPHLPASVVEALLEQFVTDTSEAVAVGSIDDARDVLSAYLPPSRLNALCDDAPVGRHASAWEKLGRVNEAVLASYLRNEYPQTAAVVLTKLGADQAARVISALPHDFALECVGRILRMEAVQPDVLERIEQTLSADFGAHLSRPSRRDGHELMADIFNRLDAPTENRFLASLETSNRPSAERIRALMFVFEDLLRLEPGAIQTLLRIVDRDQLALALKGASEPLRQTFLENMTERAGRILRDDMDAMGPVRLRDAESAQAAVVQIAKELAAKGDITLARTRSEDELVY